MRKKIDNRIRNLIENNVLQGHRSLFVIIGEKSRDQVVILHHILSKTLVKSRPNVLWCYKKELGFSSHRKKRMKQLKKQIKNGNIDVDEDDPLEFFISSTNIRYCYYAETNKIVGNTYGVCLLQDFEALTPNILAQTIETVEGGGMVIFLLNNVTQLTDLFNMSMDIHQRYKTRAHKDVISRFNERFLLSLTTCKNCLVLDDNLNILQISELSKNIEKIIVKDEDLSLNEIELKNIKESMQDTQMGPVVKLTKTLDQAKALLKFIDVTSEKVTKCTICMTASRGRGKSACLGLSIAAAVTYGYSNIFVTSPNPENIKTLFEFITKGLNAMLYEEHIDYESIRSNNAAHNKHVIRFNIFKKHRQTIQYISPNEHEKLGQCEILVIDEAAAIPLPVIKKLLGPYICFMSSTISGYEGTGRALSLKLFKQLRQRYHANAKATTIEGTHPERLGVGQANFDFPSTNSPGFYEIKLSESIRYSQGDPVEAWLNDLLCLSNRFTFDSSIPNRNNDTERNNNGYICPPPELCELYSINRDTLFSFHLASEAFLQKLVGIYVASHYKNSPNDLQMLADAPAHSIFCLIGPYDPKKSTLPEILCVVQVCLEGELSKEYVLDSLSRGKKDFGDLIPWNISQQFQDYDFPHLAGSRIVRIATHPDYQRMGYGQRALKLLTDFYDGKIDHEIILQTENDSFKLSKNLPLVEKLVEENGKGIKVRADLAPLLTKLSDCNPIRLDYVGVSYGLTSDLLRFWKRNGFVPVYLRQTPNDLTGEHPCIMLKRLRNENMLDFNKLDFQSSGKRTNDWLRNYHRDFKRRFLRLSSFQFHHFLPQLALSLITIPTFKKIPRNYETDNDAMDENSNLEAMNSDSNDGAALRYEELLFQFTLSDVKRLTMYSQNLVDYHLIMDLVPGIAQFYFLDRFEDTQLTLVQQAILYGIGLQHKSIELLEKEINLPSAQLLGLFNRLVRKCSNFINTVVEKSIGNELFHGIENEKVIMNPTEMDLKTELNIAAKEISHELETKKLELLNQDFSKYAIKGTEQDWDMALLNQTPDSKTLVSIANLQKKIKIDPGKKIVKKQMSKKKKKFK